MKGTWRRLACIALSLAGVVLLLVKAGQTAWHDRLQLGLVFAAGVGFLTLMITALVLVYWLLHQARRARRATLTTARPVVGVTATVVPRVTAAAAPQVIGEDFAVAAALLRGQPAEEQNLLVNRLRAYWAEQAAEARREIES